MRSAHTPLLMISISSEARLPDFCWPLLTFDLNQSWRRFLRFMIFHIFPYADLQWSLTPLPTPLPLSHQTQLQPCTHYRQATGQYNICQKNNIQGITHAHTRTCGIDSIGYLDVLGKLITWVTTHTCLKN